MRNVRKDCSAQKLYLGSSLTASISCSSIVNIVVFQRVSCGVLRKYTNSIVCLQKVLEKSEMALITNKDIVIVGLQPWDTEIGSNCKDIAVEMSKHNRVLYVNSPLDRITVMKGKGTTYVEKRLEIMKYPEKELVEVSSNLWIYYPDVVLESINWIKVGFIFDFLNRINNEKYSRSIQRAISRLNFTNFILFNDNDIFKGFYLPDLLNARCSVYYSRDNLLATDYWKFHGKRLEPKLIKKNDVCVANSLYLTNVSRKYNENSFYVGQGCDTTHYSYLSQLSLPDDIAEIPQPIIGYVGALVTLRLDIGTLLYLAEQHPEWSIVLVGPEDECFRQSALHDMKNVYFLGSKDPLDLPRYIAAFTVCINPQVLNEVTIGNYPRKIDEYLSMGKPVAATKTESMEAFVDYVSLSSTKEEFLRDIEDLIKTDNAELRGARAAFAASHTWRASVSEIYKAVLKVVPTL